MHLLAVNIQRSSAIVQSVYGNFSGPRQQEVVVIKGNGIELLRPDEHGRMVSVNYTPCFSVVRSILPFRLIGENTDYLVIGSDSGKLSIVQYDNESNSWKRLHCETFGKTGCRRIVPGQYLASDPKGRAICVASIEKQRFVYVMNRDGNNKLTISSPLEAHRQETITYSCVGLDVGLANPIFAMLEMEYSEADSDPSGVAVADSEKKLTYYELDLGLNHMVRKWNEPVSRTANFLLSVPGGNDGPSGVLVCGENWISYKNQDHAEIRTPLPRRHDMPQNRGLLIISGTLHKQKTFFFFLLQTELGDIYKVELDMEPSLNEQVIGKIVSNVRVSVFDTIQPATSLCITKTGLLFAASEQGNHILFQFQDLGGGPDCVHANSIFDEDLGDDAISASMVAPLFRPSPKLKSLLICDDISALSPIVDLMVSFDQNNSDNTLHQQNHEKKIHLLCGRGNRSSLRILRHGCSVTEFASSDLPGKPTGIWTLKGPQQIGIIGGASDEDRAAALESTYDKLIIVSFANATIVLCIGDTVEEVQDSGFNNGISTLAAALLSDNSRVQVHAGGVRHIRTNTISTEEYTIVEWKTPGGRFVEKASCNGRQVIISLSTENGSGSEVLNFELDAVGTLQESGSHLFPTSVSSLDVGIVPLTRSRFPYVAVGCLDDTVHILSTEGEDMPTLSMISVDARPDSLCFVQMEQTDELNTKGITGPMHLHIGLQTGVLMRLSVDNSKGSLSDSRQKFLGTRSPKLYRLNLQANAAGSGLLALSSSSWAIYSHQQRAMQSPLSYDSLDYAANFVSETCPEGIVAVVGTSLRIITIDNVGSMFNESLLPLLFTPRKILKHQAGNALVIIASDQHEFNEEEKTKLQELDEMFVEKQKSIPTKETVDEDEDDDEEGIIPLRGPVPDRDGKWASQIYILDAVEGTIKDKLELQNNEAAFSLCLCKFGGSDEEYVCIGTATGLQLHNKQCSGAYIHVYQLQKDIGKLRLLHRTQVDELPLALCSFKGRLLAGVGKSLLSYELGKKQLLKKNETKGFPSCIARIEYGGAGDRLCVGDMTESIFFLKFKRVDNSFIIFAEDDVPRFVSAMCALDYDTVGMADKFGNITVMQVDENIDDEVDDSKGPRALWDVDTRKKANCICQYYLGEMITSLKKTQFIPGGAELMVASTISGGLYAFVPLTSQQDLQLFTQLEAWLRQEYSNIVQRDHLSYRSSYQPVKAVVDGELCERFHSLAYSRQLAFAEDIGRTVPSIIKKLEDFRDLM